MSLRKQASSTRFVGSFTDALPALGLPEIAFAGRSNVGKSSALNRLLDNKKAARVSARPGRTQAINLFQIGDAVTFADLPGYGFAKVPEAVREEWKRVIESYLSQRTELALVVVLVDSRLPPQDLDVMLIDALAELELPTLVIATKVDKLTRNERHKAYKTLVDGLGLPADAVVPFSATTGEGRDEVWDRIEGVVASGQ